MPAREECGVVTWIRSPSLACRDTCRCIFKPPLASRASTLCPFEGDGSSSLLPLRLLTDRPGIEIPFQGLERVGPHGLVLRDPLVEFRQSLRFQLVDPLLRIHFDIHEPRLAEDLEVTGHGGLRAVLALDAWEPESEHVVQEEDLVVEEARLEFLGGRLADVASLRAQVGIDPRATLRDVVLRVFLHPEHGIMPSAGSGPAQAPAGVA